MRVFRLHRERFVIVLQAYLDDAGTSDDQPVAVVGGFVADNTIWDAFEIEWSSFLNDFEIGPRFHAAPFLARSGRPYSKWDDDKWGRAKSAVCKILRNYAWIGIGTAVSKNAFDEWRDSVGHYVDP